MQSSALSSLGFLFRAYPTLMLLQPSTAIMDGAFKSGSPQTHLRMLKIVQDLRSSQARSALTGKVKVEQGVNIDEVVGNVDGVADSGCA